MSDSIKELKDLAASFRDARNWKGVPMNTFTKYMYASMIGLFVLIFVSFSADAASFKAIHYLITPSAKVGKYYLKMKFDDETIDGRPLYYVAYSLKKNGGYKTIHIHTGEAYSDGKKVWMFNLDYEKAGRKSLYIFDLEDQSEEFVTIYAKPTKKGISDDDYFWSMTDANGKYLYFTRYYNDDSYNDDSYNLEDVELYSFNIETHKLTLAKRNYTLLHKSGKYACAVKKEFIVNEWDHGPAQLCEFKKSGSLKKIRNLGKDVLMPAIVGNKLYYGLIDKKSITVCRCNLNGTGLKKIKKIKYTGSYANIDFSKNGFKLYADGVTYRYNYKTKKMKKEIL